MWCGVAWYELPIAEYAAEPAEPVMVHMLSEELCTAVFTTAEKKIGLG